NMNHRRRKTHPRLHNFPTRRASDLLDAGLAKKRAWHEFPEKVCLARIMGADLTKYRAKRNFDRTPEPAGRASESVSGRPQFVVQDRKSTRLDSSHVKISYAVFCLKK